MAVKSLTQDLSQVPFSLRGSWLALGRTNDQRAQALKIKPGYTLRTMRGAITHSRDIFQISRPGDLSGAVLNETITPGKLSVTDASGNWEVLYANPDRLILQGQGAGLCLEAATHCYATLREAGNARWEANLMAQRSQLMLTLHEGSARISAPWRGDACKEIRFEILPNEKSFWRLEIHEFDTAWEDPGPPPADEIIEQIHCTAFDAWLSRFPATDEAFEDARSLAAYILWSTLVEPRGHFKREAMLMSKNWMTNVWSWDHCFNALALVHAAPGLAWDQWDLMFDFQNRFGALPDCVNDADIVWNFCKPPVHGWALSAMLKRGLKLDRETMIQAKNKLARWTEWWMRYRDENSNGLPQYNHGNDSGWDNASCFAVGMPVEGPDLATFLILQMECIADLCRIIQDIDEARSWKIRADQLYRQLDQLLWRNDRFVALRPDNETIAEGDSLVNFMPLLLGERLSEHQRTCLVNGLQRFITDFGLATENPSSPFYAADGYWRGPIWAPSTLLIVDGLKRCNEPVMAEEIMHRFCQTCAQSGMAENFNALTGEGLRDRAYSWTSSVFLLMAGELHASNCGFTDGS